MLRGMRFRVTAARAGAVVAAIALLPAATAGAKRTVYAPPGKAGATEYSETLPASGGNTTTPNASSYTPTVKSSPVGAVAKLGAGVKGLNSDAKLGSTGRKAAGFAQSTAPVAVTRSSRVDAAAVAAPGSALATGSGSAASAVAHLLSGSDEGGVGIFLPLALAFTLGLACGVTALRVARRRA